MFGHGGDVGMTGLLWALWQVTSASTIPDWSLFALCLNAFTLPSQSVPSSH